MSCQNISGRARSGWTSTNFCTAAFERKFSMSATLGTSTTTTVPTKGFNGAVTFLLRKPPILFPAESARYTRFNGAVTFLLRKRRVSSRMRSRSGRFNGAVTFLLRKPVDVSCEAAVEHTLQWGRNISVTETSGVSSEQANANWLQWGRNISVTETWTSEPCSRSHRCASMGP